MKNMKMMRVYKYRADQFLVAQRINHEKKWLWKTKMTSEEVQILYKKYLNIAFPLEVMERVWKILENEFKRIIF